MATTRYTIIIEETDGKRYKLCRILLTSDGAYFVTCPYHRSDKVFLSKRRVNYAHPSKRFGDPPIEHALIEDDDHRLKISHHPDGFVQFSGSGIVSGRNEDGSPKGLGLISWPLSNPTAGPACGVTIQKPTAFKEADAPSQGDVVFRAAELYRTAIDNGLLIEMYYFPGLWRRFVRNSINGPIIWLRHPSGTILQLRVCKSPPDNWEIGFLGIDLWPCPIDLGGDSGFGLNSPTGNLDYDSEGYLEADALFASYPALTDAVKTRAVNLEFKPRDDPPYTLGGPSPTGDL
jgi:hypothetical protein